MNRLLRISAILTSVILYSFISASQAKADIAAIRNSNTEVWGSVGGFFFNYKEQSYPPNIPDSEHGWTPSVDAGVSYMTNNNWFYALEGGVTFGTDHYNGSILNFRTGNYDIPFQTKTQETISRFDGKIGRGFALGNRVMLTPYGEIGFRYWDRNIDGMTEDYQNFDALGGLMLQVAATNRLIFTGYGSAGTTFGASMKASDINGTFNLGNFGMYKFGAKASYAFTPRWDIFTAIDYDSFRFMQSQTVNGVSFSAYEPSSRTEETTMRVGLGYHFK